MNEPIGRIEVERGTVILVLGAPRSGTSAVSHMLSELGVYFGQPEQFIDPGKFQYNPMFFELASLNALNESIITGFGHRYEDFDFLPSWEDFDEATVQRSSAACLKLVESELAPARLIGLKDPRFCFTLPVWVRVLKGAGYKVRCVQVIRSADAVIASNQHVNSHWTLGHNTRIANLSVMAGSFFAKDEERIVVDYQALVDDRSAQVRRIAKWLGREEVNLEAAEAAIKAELRHQGDRAAAPSSDAERFIADMAGRYESLVAAWRDLGLVELRRCDVPSTAETSGVGDALSLDSFQAHGNDALRGGRMDVAKLYFRDEEGGFTEAATITQRHDELIERTSFRFELPADAKAVFLRLDPSEYPGTFVAENVRINGTAVGDLTRILLNPDLVCAEQPSAARLETVSDDPRIEFDIRGVSGASDTATLVFEVDCFRDDSEARMLRSMHSAIRSVFNARGGMREEFEAHSQRAVTFGGRMQAVLVEMRARLDGVLADAQERDSAMGKRLDDLALGLESMASRMDAMGRRAAEDMQQMATRVDDRVDTLHQDFTRAGTVLDALEQQLPRLFEEQHRQSVGNMQRVTQSIFERIEALNHTLEHSRTQVASQLEGRIDSVHGDLARLEPALDEVREQLHQVIASGKRRWWHKRQ
ncbi:MAG: sulfotransferase [Rhodanobacter sp.]